MSLKLVGEKETAEFNRTCELLSEICTKLQSEGINPFNHLESAVEYLDALTMGGQTSGRLEDV